MERNTHQRPFYTLKLTGTASRLYYYLLGINDTARGKQARLHPAIHPGRKHLAEKLGVSIDAITDATNQLAREGLLRKGQIRDRAGNWRTNCYWLAATPADEVRYTLASLKRPVHREAKKPHIISTIKDKTYPPQQRAVSPSAQPLSFWLSRHRENDGANDGKSNEPPAAAIVRQKKVNRG